MTQVLNDVILLMSNGLSTYVLYRFMYVFFDTRQVRKQVAIGVYLLQFTISTFVMMEISYPMVNMLVSLLCNVLLVSCYSGTIGKKIVVILMIFSFGLGLEVIMAFILKIGFASILEKVDINVIGTLIIQMEEWLLTVILEKYLRKSRQNNDIPWGFTIAVSLELFTVTVLEIAIFTKEYIENNIKMFSIVCMILICILIIYLYQSLSTIIDERTKNRLIIQENKFYHNQAEILQENSENIRKFHHDYKNKMIVLGELLEKNDIDGMKAYLREVTNKLDSTKTYSNTGNLILDSVINYKLSKAEEQHINVLAEIKIPEKIIVQNDDMVVILGNLLDNAIEATLKLKGNRQIELNLMEVKGTICIKIVNTFDGIILKKGEEIQSRKSQSENHGIGLKSVKDIVEKYHGDMQVFHGEGIFTTILYLHQI